MKYKIVYVIMLVAMLIIAGCSSGSNTTGQAVSNVKEPIKLGLLLPLTGEAASWGQNALAGATLAVNEVNARGGVEGRRVEVVAEDDQCTSSGVSAIQKLINVDQVDALLGPICSASGGPALPIAQASGTPVVIVAASAPQLTSLGDYIFRVYPSDSFIGKAAAEFLYNDLGKRRVASIYTKNDWGEGINRVFKQRFTELGGQVVYESGALQTEKDFRTDITKVKDSGAEALYFPVYPASGIAGLKQIEEMNLGIPVVGGDTFDAEEVVKSGYGDGTFYILGKINTPEDFKARVKTVPGFENLDVSIAAPLGYDAANVMFSAIERAGSTDKVAVKEALKQTSHPGVSNSLIQFDSVGDLKNVNFEVRVIRDGSSSIHKA